MTQQYELTNGQIVTLNNNAEVAGGAKLYVYEAGTTTPLDTYSDSALSIVNANPVEADANGRFGAIFLAADDYKFVCKSSDDATTFFTVDDYAVEGTLTFTGGIEKTGVTVQLASGVNNQTGTSYTFLTTDRGKLVSFSNTSAITATLPAAGVSFPDGFYIDVENRNTGVLTISSTSNIDGNGSITLNRNEGVRLFSDGSTWYSQRGAVRDVLFKTGGELTISTGAVTAGELTYFTIDTEGDAATDDLDTINGVLDGKVIVISSADDARDVVVKHNTGNIYNPAGQDITLGKTQDIIELRYDADLTKWIVVSYQNADTELKPLTLATAQASTSGTTIDFTSLPSGLKKITVMFQGVSTNGTSPIVVQLGDSGGLETSGYLGAFSDASTATNVTAGLAFSDAAAASIFHGSMVITRIDGNNWVSQSCVGLSNTARALFAASSKGLSAELDRLSVTTVGGSDTFDAGTINILYQR